MSFGPFGWFSVGPEAASELSDPSIAMRGV
jgi:hypothetical protein